MLILGTLAYTTSLLDWVHGVIHEIIPFQSFIKSTKSTPVTAIISNLTVMQNNAHGSYHIIQFQFHLKINCCLWILFRIIALFPGDCPCETLTCGGLGLWAVCLLNSLLVSSSVANLCIRAITLPCCWYVGMASILCPVNNWLDMSLTCSSLLFSVCCVWQRNCIC